MLDAGGRIQAAFDPKKLGFRIELPEGQGDLAPAVIDLLASYQIERHIRKDQDEGPNRLKTRVRISGQNSDSRLPITPLEKPQASARDNTERVAGKV